MPTPEPELYDITVQASQTPGAHHLDIQARFHDEHTGRDQTVRFAWEADHGEDPELYVHVGRYKTRWLDGAPALSDLVLKSSAPSAAGAIIALFRHYAPMQRDHQQALQEATEDYATALSSIYRERWPHHHQDGHAPKAPRKKKEIPPEPLPPQPPETIPGIENLLKDPGPLHNVSISRGHSWDASVFDINATITDPDTRDEIPIGFIWKHQYRAPQTQHFLVGKKTSIFTTGRTKWDHLEASGNTARAKAIMAACLRLPTDYQTARQCQADYIEAFEEYIVTQFDEIAQHPPRTGKNAPERYPSMYLPGLEAFPKNIKSKILKVTGFTRSDAPHHVNVTAESLPLWGDPDDIVTIAATWDDPYRTGRPVRHLTFGNSRFVWDDFYPERSLSEDDEILAKEIVSIQDWADQTLRQCLPSGLRRVNYKLNDAVAAKTKYPPHQEP